MFRPTASSSAIRAAGYGTENWPPRMRKTDNGEGMITEPPPPPKGPLLVGVGVMAAASVGLFMVIRAHGERLVAPAPMSGPLFGDASAAAPPPSTLVPVLAALVVIIIAARLVGAVFSYFHQPP